MKSVCSLCRLWGSFVILGQIITLFIGNIQWPLFSLISLVETILSLHFVLFVWSMSSIRFIQLTLFIWNIYKTQFIQVCLVGNACQTLFFLVDTLFILCSEFFWLPTHPFQAYLSQFGRVGMNCLVIKSSY